MNLVNMKSAGTSLMKRRVVNILGSELKDKTLLIIGIGATKGSFNMVLVLTYISG